MKTNRLKLEKILPDGIIEVKYHIDFKVSNNSNLKKGEYPTKDRYLLTIGDNWYFMDSDGNILDKV